MRIESVMCGVRSKIVISRRQFLTTDENLPDDVVGASVEGATVVVVAGGGGGSAMHASPPENTSTRPNKWSRGRTLVAIMIRTDWILVMS